MGESHVQSSNLLSLFSICCNFDLDLLFDVWGGLGFFGAIRLLRMGTEYNNLCEKCLYKISFDLPAIRATSWLSNQL